MNDLDPVDDDRVLVAVDVCGASKSCSANHLLATHGGHLKRLAPGDIGEIFPVVDLWLIRDDRTARPLEFARPTRILREGGGTRRQQEYEKSGKSLHALHGGLLLLQQLMFDSHFLFILFFFRGSCGNWYLYCAGYGDLDIIRRNP